VHAAEQQRPDVARAREEWIASQPLRDPGKLIFLDETGTSTKMARLCGRSKCGKRLVCRVPFGHWKTITAILALRTDGVIAPFAIDCAMNGNIFVEYVRQVLVPALRPGDTVIMDNLSSHKGEEVRELIEGAGAFLHYLPPYSPDLNPAEQLISMVKANLRRAARRTVDELFVQIGKALDAVTPTQCQNFIRNSGYVQT